MGNFMIENKNLRVRPIVDKDKFQLAKWLSNPEILKYYEGRDNPFDVEKVEQKFFNDKKNMMRCVVEFNETPIGYVQYYEIDAKEKKSYGYPNSKEVIYGMDQFIGETAYWNKGIGTELVRSIVTYLIRKKGADRIVMDPQTENERAIRSYEKCGFTKDKLLPKRELHEGQYRDCWLMEYCEKGQQRASTYVDWGGHNLKLTWTRSDSLPNHDLITSVHGFCFYNGELMMVDLENRGWDFPGGHIETGETAEICFRREAMEEGYVEGDCTLIGYLEVSHNENPLWNEQSPYPKIGYQVFYRMDITRLHPFEAAYESRDRSFIQPEEAAKYHRGWHKVFGIMINDGKRLGD